MTDIQILTSLAQQLERTVNWWNNRALFFVALTAFAAAGYLVTSLMASHRANQLKDAQTRIIAAKDDQLRSDLKDKDNQIAETNKTAGDANERASKADEQAAKANERAGNLELEAAKQQERAAVAERQLEEVRDEIQRRVLPRTITREQRAAFIDELRRYPTRTLRLELLGDEEALAYGEQLREAFASAGWDVATTRFGIRIGRPSGILITRPSPDHQDVRAILAAFERARIPASLLTDPNAPDVVIFVGLRPVQPQ